jgi:putative inorganic carbon (hco3(-)) transporter
MKSSKTNVLPAKPSFNGWFSSSYLYRFINLSLSSFAAWRAGSWLLQWSEVIGFGLLGIVFLLAPFVSTGLIGVLLVAIAFYWLLVSISEKPRLEITSIHLWVLLYWVIATLAMAFSPAKTEAVVGWVKLTLYLAMFTLTARVLRSPRLCNWLITVFLLTALIVSCYGIRQQYLGVEQLATWNDPNSVLAHDTRVYSYLGNPNLLGGYLLPAIALSVAAILIWRSWLQKILAMLMLGANAACLFFTDSRGAWLATIALATAMFLLLYWWWRDYLPRFWRIWLLPLVFGVAAGLLTVAILGIESVRLRFESIFAGSEDSSNSFRQFVWRTVHKMIKDYPILGIGPGNEVFNAVYPHYMDPRYPALSAYSIYLEHLVEMGYLGLIGFLGLIFATFSHGWRQINRLKKIRDSQGLWVIAAIAGMIGLLVHGVVDTVWYRPSIHTLWWLMLGIIASKFEGVTEQEAHDSF